MLKIHVAPLHSSIESSVQLLFQNRPNDVISRFKEKGDSNMGELHPLEMNVFALGLLFSGNIEESIAIQSQV